MTLKRIPLVGLLLIGAACHVVRSVQPAQFIPTQKPPIVWVTYTDNSFVPVTGPTMVGDTLKGMWASVQEPVAIPIDQIQTVQAKVSSPKRTAMLFTVLGVALGGVAYTLATAGSGGDPNFLGCPKVKGTPLPDC